MKFQEKLINGKFLKRYKRFFSDIELESGEIVVAHTPNTGSMKTCGEINCKALISFNDSPTRKLRYTLEMLSNDLTWIGVNTGLTNKLAYEAIRNGVITELSGYDHLRPEWKIDQHRIDILLTKNNGEECFVEVKNVTLKINNHATFPDAVTTRGLKHLHLLKKLKDEGKRAVMLFIVQREDCEAFNMHNQIDAFYSKTLIEYAQMGLEVLVYQCGLTEDEIKINRKMNLV